MIPEVWCKLVLSSVRRTQSSGSIMVLGAIIKGSHALSLQSYLQEICETISDDEVCRVLDVSIFIFTKFKSLIIMVIVVSKSQ